MGCTLGLSVCVSQVLEIYPDGDVVPREVSRRQLLRRIGE